MKHQHFKEPFEVSWRSVFINVYGNRIKGSEDVFIFVVSTVTRIFCLLIWINKINTVYRRIKINKALSNCCLMYTDLVKFDCEYLPIRET